MDFFSNDSEEHIQSLVFFLSDALRVAIMSGDQLQQAVPHTPRFNPGMSAGEIADRLAGFRQQARDLWEVEALMLTKIIRAGELVGELREYEPELKPEFDTFRLATNIVSDLRDRLMPDAHRLFDGASQPGVFFQTRSCHEITGHSAQAGQGNYLLGGEMDVQLLTDACVQLCHALARQYGLEDVPAMLDGEVHSGAVIAGGEEEEAFLLSEIGEILPDDMQVTPEGWAGKSADDQPVRH